MQQCAAENYNDIFNAAKFIRHELETMAKWNFQGSFSDFSSLVQLSTLLRWIILGPVNAPENKVRQRSVKKTVEFITQAVTQSFMTKRQATYKSQSSHDSFVYSKIETPLNVGIGLHLHQTTRSKKRHGTAMAVVQKNSKPKTKTAMRIQSRSKRNRSNVPLYEDISVSEPAKKSVTATGSYFGEISEDMLHHYRTCDLVWFLLKAL